MTALHALWLPLLLSSVIVFIASSIIHMLSPWHKSDYPMLPNQDAIMDALRPLGIPLGDYMIPRPKDRAEMQTPEFKEKLKKGPFLVMTVMDSNVNMGQRMGSWFVYIVVVGIFGGYVAARALPPTANYLQVFRFVGATAFVGYSLGLWQMSIWYSRSWSTTIKSTVDGLIYACLTAGTFGWLWPR
jgi:hypothetical protein